MKPRKFHIFDLPSNLYLFLDDKFRYKFFNTAIIKEGSLTKLTKRLKLKYHQYIYYWKIGKQLIPLKYLKKLYELIKKDFSITEIERNIIYVRAKRGFSVNITLPIKENINIIKIVAHLIGDGFGGSKRNQAAYFNKNKKVLEDFKMSLESLGNIPVTKIGNLLRFPKIVADILSHIYKIKFGTFESKLPLVLFRLPRRYTIAFISAFIDDEGSVNYSRIDFNSSNLKLLRGIRKLIFYKFPSYSLSKISGKRAFRFSLSSQNICEFNKLNMILHSDKCKKLELFYKIHRLDNRRDKNNFSKNKILYILNKQPLTAIELSERLLISPNTIRDKHLKILCKMNLVKAIRQKDGANLFILNRS